MKPESEPKSQHSAPTPHRHRRASPIPHRYRRTDSIPHRCTGSRLVADQQGVYAPFIAIIATSLLFLGSAAYDMPRLLAARQDALHSAFEAATVAAATIAAGGTIQQAEDAAQTRLDKSPLIYGEDIQLVDMDCVGALVEVTVETGYVYRSVFVAIRERQDIQATGAAEARLILPSGEPAELSYLAECPLHPSS